MEEEINAVWIALLDRRQDPQNQTYLQVLTKYYGNFEETSTSFLRAPSAQV